MISAAQRKLLPIFTRKSDYLVCTVILSGIILAVIQDYLVTVRHNTPFVFYESLLFKCVWVVFLLAYTCSYNSFSKIKKMSYQKLILLYGALIVSHVLMATVMVWGLSWTFKEQGYGLTKILVFTFANDSTKILLIYFLSIIYLRNFHTPTLHKEELKETRMASEFQPKSLQIKNGKSHFLISFESILCIKADSPYVIIQTKEGQYLHSSSLKKVAEELDARFVKIHRSCIVNMDKVTYYQSRLNGDYDVSLSESVQVRLSRNYAKQFKTVIEDTLTM